MPDTELETQTWTKLALIAERARQEPQVPVYELGSFAGRGVPGGMLPPARQGPGQWRGWCDVEGVRRAPGREPAGLGGPDEGEAVSSRCLPNGSTFPKTSIRRGRSACPPWKTRSCRRGSPEILEAIYEADFLDCSYGFRPGRGCHQALDAVDKTIMTQPDQPRHRRRHQRFL